MSLRKRWIALLCLVLVPIGGLLLMSLFSKPSSTIGLNEGKLSPCPDSPNCVCSFETDKEHSIEPFELNGESQTAIERLESLVRSQPRTRIVTSLDYYLHVEFTSLIFRFVDDVEFLMDPTQGVIHVRSASRVGYSDLGANRKRVEKLRELWNSSQPAE